MQAERRLKTGMRQIELARDQQRAPQFRHRFFRRQVLTLVEPFWHQKLGASSGRAALAFDLDLDAYKRLRRRVDDDRAEPERPGESDRALKERDVSYGQTIRHQAIFCLSMICPENRFPLFRIML